MPTSVARRPSAAHKPGRRLELALRRPGALPLCGAQKVVAMTAETPDGFAAASSPRSRARRCSRRPRRLRLARRVERGDLAAKGRMIEANLRLVVHVAKRFAARGPRPHAARPGPGGHDRPAARGREVRPPQGLSLLHLRRDLDPPVDQPRHRRQGQRDPPARPSGPAAARGSIARSGACWPRSAAGPPRPSWPRRWPGRPRSSSGRATCAAAPCPCTSRPATATATGSSSAR